MRAKAVSPNGDKRVFRPGAKLKPEQVRDLRSPRAAWANRMEHQGDITARAMVVLVKDIIKMITPKPPRSGGGF